MPKNPAKYVDCKIKEKKIAGNSEKRIVSIDFGNLRIKHIPKLVKETTVKGQQRNLGHLLKWVGFAIQQTLDIPSVVDLSGTVLKPVFRNKAVLLEIAVPTTDVAAVKKAIRRLLKKDYKLNAVIIK